MQDLVSQIFLAGAIIGFIPGLIVGGILWGKND